MGLIEKYRYKIWRHLNKKYGSRGFLLPNIDCRSLLMQPAVVQQHQKVFSGYRGMYRDKDIVLLATGPTFEYCNRSHFPKDAIFVGVNSVILSDKFDLDYLFVTDYNLGLKDKKEAVLKANKPNCKRFYGIMPIPPSPDDAANIMQFPIKYIDDSKAEFFFITETNIFNWDISLFSFNSFGSVVFPALQFITYTQPRRIYIVGCDCSGTHFNDDIEIPDENKRRLAKAWNRFEKEMKIWYPDIEIVSVNPIGLRGKFTDVYTKEFLESEQGTEIEDKEGVNIL